MVHAAEDIEDILRAARAGDWDLAMQRGFLDLAIDASWPDADALRSLQQERLRAAQARNRYLAKAHREAMRQKALAEKRSATQGTGSASPLPSAAQSALERAKARAKAKRP